MKRLAIVGSSGGNLYNQGGNDPYGMMREIFTQAGAAGVGIGYVQFIGTTGSMDNISQDARAKLYFLENGEIHESPEASLKEINKLAEKYDNELASLIESQQIDGMMLMSCDPGGVNNKAITAAAKMQIPVAGTGGTSIANTQAMGCKVIAAPGTTGTTNRTRAISAMAAFSKEWDIKFTPIIGSSGKDKIRGGNVWKRINFRGIMMASMPGFIAMALCLALSKLPGLAGLGLFHSLQGYSL